MPCTRYWETIRTDRYNPPIWLIGNVGTTRPGKGPLSSNGDRPKSGFCGMCRFCQDGGSRHVTALLSCRHAGAPGGDALGDALGDRFWERARKREHAEGEGRSIRGRAATAWPRRRGRTAPSRPGQRAREPLHGLERRTALFSSAEKDSGLLAIAHVRGTMTHWDAQLMLCNPSSPRENDFISIHMAVMESWYGLGSLLLGENRMHSMRASRNTIVA
jgi:hypothetical protein